jgi:Spy/CpxP family protein refolding chaperone
LNTKIKELEHRKKAIKTTRNNMINSALTPEQKKELEKQKNKKKRKK